MEAALSELIHTILTAPLTAAAVVTGGALLLAVWVPGRLRRLGFQPDRRDSELDWAGMIGLVLGMLGMLLGLSGVAASAELPAVSKLLVALFRTLLTLTPALAILAGAGHAIAARRQAALSRQEEDLARTEGRWIARGAMLIATLTLVEMSLSLPAIVLIAGAIWLWLYRSPDARKKMEDAWGELKAGQQLRSRQLTAGDAVDEFQLAGPVGLFDTRVEGQTEPVSNIALLEKMPPAL